MDARFLSDVHGRHFACSGEGAGEFNHGEAEDVDHQHGAAAVAIGEHAEEQCADGAKHLGEKDCAQHAGRFGVELRGDGRDAKDEDEEVERVHGPAEESGKKSVALRPGEPAEVLQDGPEMACKRL